MDNTASLDKLQALKEFAQFIIEAGSQVCEISTCDTQDKEKTIKAWNSRSLVEDE